MIRLVTVVGHGINLVPHFISHYRDLVDEIYIGVYETELYPNISSEIKELIKDENKVKIVKTIRDRVFDWDKVTSLYNFIKNTHSNDWWVVADIDEFHVYSTDLKNIIENCGNRGNDIVRGGFIDRLGPNGEFSEIVSDIDIFEQFPLAGFFRYPMSGANPNKICITKGYIELTSGQHYAKINGNTTWRWQGWNHPLINPLTTVQVHHFKWDSTSFDRLLSVADIKQEYSYSNEYAKMSMALRKCKHKIDIENPMYMFQITNGSRFYDEYTNWNKLINKIMSI